jgi:hypothetical protein
MRTEKLASAVGFSVLLACLLASPSSAQERSRQRAPFIRIYSRSGEAILQTTTYVSPAIEVSENAYVFAVSMDLDGQIQVLHPDFPGISVKILARRQLQLPNFFVGFAQTARGNGMYSSADYPGYNGYGIDDSRGTVIALASRAPFDLERIESNGDWNISAIRRLIENRSPQMAAQMLASYLGANGEPIGRDYMRFAGGRSYYYASGYDAYGYSACDSYYGFAYGALRRAQVWRQINFLQASGRQVRILGYDFCGNPIVVPANSTPSTGFPMTRPPHGRGDTTVFPKARFPREGMPRHPRDASASTAAEGIFPLSRRPGLPQMGDVTITAPRTRHNEPRVFIDDYRSQPGTMAAPQGRLPIDRSVPRTEPAAATGAQPLREYRPEPRVQAPPPARAPDPPRESPPPTPVVHERPSTPPPPPPRAETPTKPPPSRQ